MSPASFLEKLKQTPETIAFTETIATIEENYTFTPTTFHNGSQINAAGENSGSCKLFAFAQLQNLTEAETLACFGAYYYEDVLKNPAGTDHQNIRNFMKTGWNAIQFEGTALVPK
ncbi:HopJ type III effector protein [Flavobacterium sp. ZS1P14]|uniref:HopJ type III effector protein n=1 Tax=Flavobacterium sp. ZS1P14 TaxID=3401729 RepID=UPI003AB0E2DC